jgi:hypothetical protein
MSDSEKLSKSLRHPVQKEGYERKAYEPELRDANNICYLHNAVLEITT